MKRLRKMVPLVPDDPETRKRLAFIVAGFAWARTCADEIAAHRMRRKVMADAKRMRWEAGHRAE